MRKVSIIGSGTSSLFAAHALIRQDYDVTVYSDRTAEDWLHRSAPTGTAYLYGSTIALETELGIEHWYDDSYKAAGVHLDFQPTAGAERLIATGNFEGPGAAIDIRMRVARWMHDFEELGGKIVYHPVTLEELDKIAKDSDVTLLAVGKGEVGRVVPRDPARSVYDKPQRLLCMCIVQGVENPALGRTDMLPVKFNFFGDAGEYFWVPYTHKDVGDSWCWLMEAKPGSYLDRFAHVQSAAEATEVMSEVIREVAPYEWDNVKDMRPVDGDEHCWLKGAFPPTVRQGSAVLPSGGLVVPIGDTAVLFDPIGGQGGNCAHKNAKYVTDAIVARSDEPFDEAWAQTVMDGFWDFHARSAYTFNNILLEPLTDSGRAVLGYSAQNRTFADNEFFGNMNKPNNYFPWLEDLNLAQEKIAQYA